MNYTFEDLKNKTIIITGGSGFLGSQFVESFLNIGSNVVNLDKKINKKMIRNKKNFLNIKCNISKEEDVKKVTKFLTNRLTILEMVHKNTKLLFELPQFKQQFFTCDYKNKLKVENNFIIKDKLIDLLKAYAQIHKRNQQYTLKFSCTQKKSNLK